MDIVTPLLDLVIHSRDKTEKFTIGVVDDELFLDRDDGESMSIDEEKFFKVLEKFWLDNY